MRKILVLFLLFSLLVTSAAYAGNEVKTALDEDIEGDPLGYAGEAFWTLLSFFVLLAVLWKFAWKPMLYSLRAREEFISKQVSDAEDVRKKAEAVLAEYNDKLADADREGKDIIVRHTKEAEKESKEIVDHTRKELEELRAKLKAEIEYERKEAHLQFLDQAGDIVLELGKEVLGKSIDRSDNERLIDEAIERLKQEEKQNKEAKQK